MKTCVISHKYRSLKNSNFVHLTYCIHAVVRGEIRDFVGIDKSCFSVFNMLSCQKRKNVSSVWLSVSVWLFLHIQHSGNTFWGAEEGVVDTQYFCAFNTDLCPKQNFPLFLHILSGSELVRRICFVKGQLKVVGRSLGVNVTTLT